MERPFGANLARSSMRSMPWIAANHKKEDDTSVSMLIGRTADLRGCRLFSFERLSSSLRRASPCLEQDAKPRIFAVQSNVRYLAAAV